MPIVSECLAPGVEPAQSGLEGNVECPFGPRSKCKNSIKPGIIRTRTLMKPDASCSGIYSYKSTSSSNPEYSGCVFLNRACLILGVVSSIDADVKLSKRLASRSQIYKECARESQATEIRAGPGKVCVMKKGSYFAIGRLAGLYRVNFAVLGSNLFSPDAENQIDALLVFQQVRNIVT